MIELIQNAIVVASTTVYVDHTYRWRNTPQWKPYITCDSNTTTTLNLSALQKEGNESLINLAKSIIASSFRRRQAIEIQYPWLIRRAK